MSMPYPGIIASDQHHNFWSVPKGLSRHDAVAPTMAALISCVISYDDDALMLIIILFVLIEDV